MFGMFRSREIVARWRFFGRPDAPGAVVYSREAGAVEGLVPAWMFSLAVAKTLFTVGKVEVTSAACLNFMAISDALADTGRPGFNPFDFSVFDTFPKNLDATLQQVERLPLHRTYLFEYVKAEGQELPRLQTSWPREYSPADVLTIFRVLGKETLAMTQSSMGTYVTRGVFSILLQRLAVEYGNDAALHTKASSVVQVPMAVVQYVMSALDQATGQSGR